MQVGCFLDYRYFPIGGRLVFDNSSMESYLEGAREYGFEIKEVQGSLDAMVREYARYFYGWHSGSNAYIIFETDSPWLSHLGYSRSSRAEKYKNINGQTDVFISLENNTHFIYRRADGKETGNLGSVKFDCYYTYPEGKQQNRSLMVSDQGGYWDWDEVGDTPFPFEDLERYQLKKLTDRLTPELLDQYARFHGIRAYDEDFYKPHGYIIYDKKLPQLAPGTIIPYRSIDKVDGFIEEQKRYFFSLEPDVPVPLHITPDTLAELKKTLQAKYRQAIKALPTTNEEAGDIRFDGKAKRYVGTGWVPFDLRVSAIYNGFTSGQEYIDLGSSKVTYAQYVVALGEDKKRNLKFLETPNWVGAGLAARKVIELAATMDEMYDKAESAKDKEMLEKEFSMTFEDEGVVLVAPKMVKHFAQARLEDAIAVARYQREEEEGERLSRELPPVPEEARLIELQGINVPIYELRPAKHVFATAAHIVALRLHSPDCVIIIRN